jgi:hypothetical protein
VKLDRALTVLVLLLLAVALLRHLSNTREPGVTP